MLLPPVHCSKSGLRDYDESDLIRKKILEDQRQWIRGRIADLQRTLELLDHKIAWYEQAVMPAERELLAARDASEGRVHHD